MLLRKRRAQLYTYAPRKKRQWRRVADRHKWRSTIAMPTYQHKRGQHKDALLRQTGRQRRCYAPCVRLRAVAEDAVLCNRKELRSHNVNRMRVKTVRGTRKRSAACPSVSIQYASYGTRCGEAGHALQGRRRSRRHVWATGSQSEGERSLGEEARVAIKGESADTVCPALEADTGMIEEMSTSYAAIVWTDILTRLRQ